MKKIVNTIIALLIAINIHSQSRDISEKTWDKYWGSDEESFIPEPWKSLYSYSDFDATIRTKEAIENHSTALSIINYDDIQFDIQIYFVNELTDGYYISAYIQDAGSIGNTVEGKYVYICLMNKGGTEYKGVITSTIELKQLSRGIADNNASILIEDVNKSFSYRFKNLKD